MFTRIPITDYGALRALSICTGVSINSLIVSAIHNYVLSPEVQAALELVNTAQSGYEEKLRKALDGA
jgi:hypothetical protein